MAVKMNGQLHYQEIQAGVMIRASRQASPIIPEYENAVRDIVSRPNLGYVHNLSPVGIEKRQTVLSVSVDSVIGIVVPTQTQDGTRTYRILPGQKHGDRKQRVQDSDMRTVDQERGTRIAKVLTGVGAFGVGYNPTPPSGGTTQIRKYPRDWHGENMH